LEKQWQQRLKRVRYDAELAERRYQAVDPTNRLVAAGLEKRWDDLLRQQQQIQEEYDRFVTTAPHQFSDAERTRIGALASDIPSLWHHADTSNSDRKKIIRCLVERVTVNVRCDSELVDVTIQWAGGYVSQHEVIRPVATYAQLSDYERLMNRLTELRQAGRTAAEIAVTLNAEGFHPPKTSAGFAANNVHELLERRGLIRNERTHDELLHEHEWWVMDLARELKMSHLKLRAWATRGWVHSRRSPVQGYWILWADEDEVRRLRQLLAESHRGANAYSSTLKMPKKR
jgi:hypothetical protein